MQHINETNKNYMPTEKQILAVSAGNSEAYSKEQTSPSASGTTSVNTTNALVIPTQAYFMTGFPNQHPG